MYNRNKNVTGYQSLHENPVAELFSGCATYILGPPKVQTLSTPSIFPNPV